MGYPFSLKGVIAQNSATSPQRSAILYDIARALEKDASPQHHTHFDSVVEQCSLMLSPYYPAHDPNAIRIMALCLQAGLSEDGRQQVFGNTQPDSTLDREILSRDSALLNKAMEDADPVSAIMHAGQGGERLVSLSAAFGVLSAVNAKEALEGGYYVPSLVRGIAVLSEAIQNRMSYSRQGCALLHDLTTNLAKINLHRDHLLKRAGGVSPKPDILFLSGPHLSSYRDMLAQGREADPSLLLHAILSNMEEGISLTNDTPSLVQVRNAKGECVTIACADTGFPNEEQDRAYQLIQKQGGLSLSCSGPNSPFRSAVRNYLVTNFSFMDAEQVIETCRLEAATQKPRKGSDPEP